ncbi:MAG: prenyltransferase/squalene oxidase repeat-containing protein [Pirellulales bacterium]
MRNFLALILCISLCKIDYCQAADENTSSIAPEQVLLCLRAFYDKTARPDGSFQPGIDPEYLGMSDCAYSDLAAVTYACTIHKTFGWKLPHEDKTIEFLLGRQRKTGEFVNVAGTVDPASPQGKVYNTTQALVALRALGVRPRHDPLGVFEEILKQDYKTLPAYSTSFFPLAYLCYGKPIPEQADRAIRALMIQDEDGYLNDHIAATFHASHYYALVGDPTPKPEQMIARILRDQNANGSWFLNQPARDRHATFDAVFTLLHEGRDRADCRAAIERAAQWALACRNGDGGFGHFPGSTSDADAVYFQVGTLVMAGFLKPAEPLPADPQLLSWGHLMPVRRRPPLDKQVIIPHPGWVGGVALSADGKQLATACSDHVARLWETTSGKLLGTFKGHTDCVAAIALSADGRMLATGAYDHIAKIWNASSGKILHTLAAHRGAVTSVAFAPDGNLLASGGIDGRVMLWDLKTGQQRQTLVGHKSWVNSVAFNPDGSRLVSASSDGALKVWVVAKGELVETISASKAEPRSVAVSPDNKWIAAGIRYGAVKVWSAKNYKERHSLQFAVDDVSAVAFSPDSRQLLVGTGEWNRPGRVEVIDIDSGKSVAQLKHTGEVLSLAISRDGATIAAGGGDHAASVWLNPISKSRAQD